MKRFLLGMVAAPTVLALMVPLDRASWLWAQTPKPLEGLDIPTTLEAGSQITIVSSETMRWVNDLLSSRFAEQYGGVPVDVTYSNSDAALQDLLAGKTDLAAIGRDLSEAEQQAGLKQLSLARHKIAIVIGADNPFGGSLTDQQFAQIFRGELTNWSQVGGPDAPIVLVDRPATNDTRQAFRQYSAFQNAPLAGAPKGVVLSEDSTAALIEQLGATGIGYAVAEQVMGNPAVKIVPLYDTLPDDPRYPFSQPLAYAFKAANATPAALAYLGYVSKPESKAAIETARPTAITARPEAPRGTATPPGTEPPTEAQALGESEPPVAETPAPATPGASGTPAVPVGTESLAATQPEATQALSSRYPWWPWLLALPVLGGLLWWLLRGAAPVIAAVAASGDRRLILTPRDCRDAYAYWELPESEVAALRRQKFSLRLKLHDVTDIADVDQTTPHRTESFACETVAVGDQHLAIAVDNRDYLVELGYVDSDQQWHALARSAPVRVPACPTSALPAGLAGAAGVAPAAIPEPLPESARVIFTPRDSRHGYTYWEIPAAQVQDLQTHHHSLKVRLYDVTELPGHLAQGPNSLQEFEAELTPQGDLHLPIAIDDRNYLVEVGYVDGAGHWQTLAKSNPVRVPASTESTAQLSVGGGTSIRPLAAPAIAVSAAAGVGLGATVGWGGAPPAQAKSEPPPGIGLRSDQGAESKIIVVPRGAEAAYIYWEVAEVHKTALKNQGGSVLALRIHDATDLDSDQQPPHRTQEYILQDTDQDQHVAIAVPDRDYVAELGYLTDTGQWLPLVRSLPVRIPMS